MKKAVLIFSGGVDSTTLLYELLDNNYEVFPVTFFYGQRHKREIDYAKKTILELGLKNWIGYPLTALGKIGGSALTDDIAVPEGNYDEDSMKDTVVPNRNMILLSFAMAHAIRVGVLDIYYGAHAGDHAIYPDCREAFVDAMKVVAKVCHYEPINIEAPYLHMTKESIVERGLVLGVNYANAWTCYKGEALACGKCGSCTERLEAFALNGEKDPIEYIA